MIAAFLKWFAIGFCAALGGAVVTYYTVRTLAKLRSLRRAGWAVCFVAAVAIIHGGTKNLLPRFTADEGLAVTAATMNRATNEVDATTLEVSWTGAAENRQIWVRKSAHDQWTALGDTEDGWAFDVWEFDGVTNSARYSILPGPAASNATVWTQWHLGDDLPSVEIDGDGVTIEAFAATSKAVSIRYGVNPSALGANGGDVHVEVQRKNEAWDVLSSTHISTPETNTVTFAGFWVGEITRWRVRLEVRR